MMRHLVVPNREVEAVLGHIRARGWGSLSHRVFSSEDGYSRLIPLDPGAPLELPTTLEYPIEMHEGLPDEKMETNWLTLLSSEIGEGIIEEKGEAWPSNHEFIGDLMIVRIDEEVSEYTDSIARAKLGAHPHIRLLLADDGVEGEFRIRQLRPIGARLSDRILAGPTLEFAPPELLTTEVAVKESGRVIRCDPVRAYFSTKLQTERLETLALAKELREQIGRPLRVADPFCGVGPALATLLGESNLVSDLLATDLNPNAIELLMTNLSKWDRRPYPEGAIELQQVHENRLVGLADALTLSENQEIAGKWDLVLVNLPHRTIEFLPAIIPLLDRSSPSMIRGRVIVEESEIEQANQTIRAMLPNLMPDKPQPSLKIKRDYSSSLRLCSFEAWVSEEVRN
jgi:tRNA G37 N-methylase Trm5